MSDLDLSVPKVEHPPESKQSSNPLWNIVIIVLLVVCAIGIWMPKKDKEDSPIITDTKSIKLPSGTEDIIVKLKKGGAFEEAADMIGLLSQQEGVNPQRKARLLKRQGDLYLQGDLNKKALRSYYLSEQANQKKDADLERETTQAILGLLRKIGQYSAVSAELASKNRERLGQKNKNNDPIVAKVDGKEIPLSDFELALDKHINQRIFQLTMKVEKEEEKKRIAEQTKKQYHAPYEKLKFLQQWISDEVLYREAVIWKIDKMPKFIEQMEDYRKFLMRQQLFESKVKVDQVSDIDLKNYVSANRTNLGLSTDPGQLKPEEFNLVRAEAEIRYKTEKTKEMAELFQKEVSQRHQVEIFNKVFTEGGN